MKKVDFADDNKSMKIYPACKVLNGFIYYDLLCFRFGGRKPKTMMSMVEGEYLDPSMTTTENEVGFCSQMEITALYVCITLSQREIT